VTACLAGGDGEADVHNSLEWRGLATSNRKQAHRPGRETLDQAIHDAHEAGLVIVDVFRTLGSAKEEQPEKPEGPEAA